MTTRKTERPPRLIPSGQVHHELNPIFAQIVNLVKQTKNPEHFKRDLLIDKRQIAQRKPNSVLWGVRSTGTDLVCLSKGGHKGAETRLRPSMWTGGHRMAYYDVAKSHIEYPNGNDWYYITGNTSQHVTKEQAVKILEKYATGGRAYSTF